MRQSNVIFGVLIFAFIVYITMRGQLPAYMDLFKPAPPKEKSGGGGLFGKWKKLFNTGKDIAKKAAKAYVKSQTGGMGG